MSLRPLLLLAGVGTLLAACTTDDPFVGPGNGVAAPANLTYQVEPNGTDDLPAGILLRWDFDPDPDIAVWRVYSRATTGGQFGLRGSTTSNSFHDVGLPHLEYYVTAEDFDGVESEASNVVVVDERLALEVPENLRSVSLDGAIALLWDDNAFQAEPNGFANYRVYSASYDLDAGLCGNDWGLEGTTIAPEFRSGVLQNGVPRCFAVSSVAVEGYESLWSAVRADTPRPESRNVALWAADVTPAESGFRFWLDQNANGLAERSELGGVGGAAGADLVVTRDGSGRMFLEPARAGVTVRAYEAGLVPDLTSVDFAPADGYGASPIEARPGWGYVVQIAEADGFFRYGALRTGHVGQEFLLVDWAYQTDPGNPELRILPAR